MSKHTPGPWIVDNTTLRGSINRLAEPRRHIALASDYQKTKQCFEENQANAILIAAAPDLLEALIGMVEAYEYEASPENPALLAAKAAILKATGEQP